MYRDSSFLHLAISLAPPSGVGGVEAMGKSNEAHICSFTLCSFCLAFSRGPASQINKTKNTGPVAYRIVTLSLLLDAAVFSSYGRARQF